MWLLGQFVDRVLQQLRSGHLRVLLFHSKLDSFPQAQVDLVDLVDLEVHLLLEDLLAQADQRLLLVAEVYSEARSRNNPSNLVGQLHTSQ